MTTFQLWQYKCFGDLRNYKYTYKFQTWVQFFYSTQLTEYVVNNMSPKDKGYSHLLSICHGLRMYIIVTQLLLLYNNLWQHYLKSCGPTTACGGHSEMDFMMLFHTQYKLPHHKLFEVVVKIRQGQTKRFTNIKKMLKLF